MAMRIYPGTFVTSEKTFDLSKMSSSVSQSVCGMINLYLWPNYSRLRTAYHPESVVLYSLWLQKLILAVSIYAAQIPIFISKLFSMGIQFCILGF